VQPSHDAIRAQLERIAASPQFAGSARLARFLRFVVERSLAGEGARLKEYVIGTEVFDRGGDYDPRIDSIVRVEAGRLRSKLEEYYRNGGRDDAVRIGLLKGSYVPQFEQQPDEAAPRSVKSWKALAGSMLAGVVALLVAAAVLWDLGRESPAPPTTPVIAVLPFVPFDQDPAALALGERLTEGIAAQFVRDGRLAVVPSARSARFSDPRSIPDDIGRQLGAQFLLRGRVLPEPDGRLRIEAVLMDGQLSRKPWGDSYAGSVDDLDQIELRIAREAADAALGHQAGTD
jgi:adenylate cyclase